MSGTNKPVDAIVVGAGAGGGVVAKELDRSTAVAVRRGQSLVLHKAVLDGCQRNAGVKERLNGPREMWEPEFIERLDID